MNYGLLCETKLRSAVYVDCLASVDWSSTGVSLVATYSLEYLTGVV